MFFLLVASAIGHHVSGTWQGTITIPAQGGEGEQETTAYMVLKQQDGQVTGPAGNAVMTIVLKRDGEERKGAVRGLRRW